MLPYPRVHGWLQPVHVDAKEFGHGVGLTGPLCQGRVERRQSGILHALPEGR